jgi:formylglycine-generating enzyme
MLKAQIKLWSLGLILSALWAVPAFSQTSAPTLQQAVSQLQGDPDNQKLREQIIKLARKAKPQTPDAVDEIAGGADYLVKSATSKTGYTQAIEQYQKALLLAPWSGELYFALGDAQEKAGEPDKAAESYQLYLLASPRAKDAKQIRGRIGALKMAAQTDILIPGGTFLMGSPDGKGWRTAHPQHQVTVSSFYLDKDPVTNEQFQKFIDATHYVTQAEKGDGGGYVTLNDGTMTFFDKARWNDPQGDKKGIVNIMDHPVVMVSWDDAQAYCQWAGKRLPTEAEYEYALRGGTTTDYFWGDDPLQAGDYAWDAPNSGMTSQPVGQKKPNPYGLYDMAGNVWEWCSDWFDNQYPTANPETDPQGLTHGLGRVNRGGSWGDPVDDLVSAARGEDGHDFRGDCYGFRCARTP